MVLILFVPGVPFDPFIQAFPLLLVISISAVREAIEDFLRFRSDQRINSTICHRWKHGTFSDCCWSQLLVGDLVHINRDEQIPADLIVLATPDSDGISFVETANLDGETNLKARQAIGIGSSGLARPEWSLMKLGIQCDLPNRNLYEFHGMVVYDDMEIPLDNQNVMLRGCVLRNTEYVIGVIVYTGLETKLLQNSSSMRTKLSRLDQKLNFKIVPLFAFIVIWGLIAAGIGFSYQFNDFYHNAWYFYFQGSTDDKTVRYFTLFISHSSLISAIIPISLYVTLETVRVIQALFVGWDRELIDRETEIKASVRTTTVSDDLGQIEYIFSDKTGTLTRNVMEFMKCSVAGKTYGQGMTEVAYAAACRQGLTVAPLNASEKAFRDAEFMGLLGNPSEDLQHFLWLLAVCHSVIPEADDTQPYGMRYQASSPDEAALVLAAADFGFVLNGRSADPRTVTVNNRPIEILAELEFTSERKRSSVIIRHPNTGDIVLYCKGADDLIYERLSPDSQYREITSRHLREFASDGLRTLCCAYRIIDSHFFEDWYERYLSASGTIQDHDLNVDRLCNEIERDLMLIGATAIEDKLQIDVADTITSLLDAHISVWVLTGDKRETAINIGFACGVISSGMELLSLGDSEPEKLHDLMKSKMNSTFELAMIVSGDALVQLLGPGLVDDFFQCAMRCRSIICCRVSPSQKASVVKLIRDRTRKLTLAIGDGANDVGMIRQADIGIGLCGKEGRQAVLASDYAFGEFRFLKRLLLFHGRLSFYRNIELIHYCFYKNMVFSFVQIIYQFFCAFSGTSVYHSVLFTIFNVVFTSIPPIVYASLEKDEPVEKLMQRPSLYVFDGHRTRMQSFFRFTRSLAFGIFHALICFGIPYFALQPFVDGDGMEVGLEQFGVIVYAIVIVVVNIKLAVMCNHWTGLHFFFFIGSILLYPVVIAIISFGGFSKELNDSGLAVFLMPGFWLTLFATVFICLFIELFLKTWRFVVRRPEPIMRPLQDLSQRPRAGVSFPDQVNPTGSIMEVPAALQTTRLASRTASERFLSRAYPSANRFASVALPPRSLQLPSTFVAPADVKV